LFFLAFLSTREPRRLGRIVACLVFTAYAALTGKGGSWTWATQFQAAGVMIGLLDIWC
jgi:hypothetical protein